MEGATRGFGTYARAQCVLLSEYEIQFIVPPT
jgi:hypothetical protein